MNRVTGTLVTLSISFTASSCSLLNGRCLYESRNAFATGSIMTSATDSASATLVESEQRDYQPDKNFSWQVLGPDLKNHVQKIVVLESATASAPRYDFPLDPATTSQLSGGFVRESEGTNLSGMFDLLSSSKALVRITTDLPEKQTIIVPLMRVQSEGWSRPYCS